MTSSKGDEAMSGCLNPGTDSVLECHMYPSGKPEEIQASVVFFAKEPPRHVPLFFGRINLLSTFLSERMTT